MSKEIEALEKIANFVYTGNGSVDAFTIHEIATQALAPYKEEEKPNVGAMNRKFERMTGIYNARQENEYRLPLNDDKEEVDKEAIEKLAWETWGVVNNQLPNGINPTPFILGFKYGYSKLESKEEVDKDEVDTKK
jgi:hypothetical protein